MSANNSKPKDGPPVVVLREEPNTMGRYLLLMLPAMIGSVLFHVGLVAIFIVYIMLTAETPPAAPEESPQTVNAEEVEKKNETFTVVDVDPSMSESDTDIQYMAERIAEVSVPGKVNADQAVGIRDADKSAPPVSLPNPGGYVTGGQGGAIEISGIGNSNAVGEVGGGNMRGMALQGAFNGRSGATREYSLREGGGTSASEAAVTKGLQWLIRQQKPDGSWSLSSTVTSRPSAGTAFGLLPFLAAGKHHKNPGKDNPYDKQIAKSLEFLKRHQEQDGYFKGGDMYDHGLATIAICEAYGLSQDPTLRRPAQNAINVIVKAQSETGGGWGYGRTGGADMSVSGWQIMALKSGQMAGLIVPMAAIERTKRFLDAGNPDGGFAYANPTPGGSTSRMTAVGLLCRQYMQNKGPSDEMMQKGVRNFIKKTPPGVQDVYYYYYATQVMHHFGGEEWRDWNEKMREYLIKKQDVTKTASFGSWSPEGDPWSGSGGRLMITSLNLLTLEVYYRYLPLYYRDAGYGKDGAVQKAL
jgi:hypothetical protein